MNKIVLFWCWLLLSIVTVNAQSFTHSDSLRGTLNPLRTCYNVLSYDLTVQIDIAHKSISGSNKFFFGLKESVNSLQFDLATEFQVDSIIKNQKQLSFDRIDEAVIVHFQDKLIKNNVDGFTVYYHGTPPEAKMAPWDGGFVWQKDENGNPWVAVACEGVGASSWWPCKDHLSDEPNAMSISIVIKDAMDYIPGSKNYKKYGDMFVVSNGKFIGEKYLDGAVAYLWKVSNPINNYNVTFYLGDYAPKQKSIKNGDAEIKCTYWLLKSHIDSVNYLQKYTPTVLRCFEYYFGDYPFKSDGYQLVEAPYVGMEHQSAIAYGNKFVNGYRGLNPLHLDFDYIIMHETAHEWWGNNVSCSDLADLWIHESFATYAEALYFEFVWNKSTADDWMQLHRKNIKNERPIIGPMDVNYDGSKYDIDMYYKGAWMLYMLRKMVDNDNLFFGMLKGLQTNFALKTTNTDEILNYMSNSLGKSYRPYFNQYLYHTRLPVLLIKDKGDNWEIILSADEKAFAMKLELDSKDYNFENGKPIVISKQIVPETHLNKSLEAYLLTIKKE